MLSDIERSGATISAKKSEFLKDRLKIVAYICGADGRMPEAMKVRKIQVWRPCRTTTEAKAFIGLCVYYRLWVRDFAVRAEPIFRLFRKKASFVWGFEQQEAMDDLKNALTSPPALRPIDYEEGGAIVLSVDSSLQGWGAILQQAEPEEPKKRHPSRYESGLWTDPERKYDSGKLECRGLLKALKKLRFYLYGIHFQVEIDAKTLIHQLNQPASDLPGSVVHRWLAWIRLFSFDIKHVLGVKHQGPDALSRRPRGDDSEEEEDPEDLEAAMDADLDGMTVGTFFINAADYPDDLRPVIQYLLDPVRPDGMSNKDFRRLRAKALDFLIQDEFLYRRSKVNMPPRRVIVN